MNNSNILFPSTVGSVYLNDEMDSKSILSVSGTGTIRKPADGDAHTHLDHLDGASLLEESGELSAVDAEWQVADEDPEIRRELLILLAAGLPLRLEFLSHGRRRAHGCKRPPARRRGGEREELRRSQGEGDGGGRGCGGGLGGEGEELGREGGEERGRHGERRANLVESSGWIGGFGLIGFWG